MINDFLRLFTLALLSFRSARLIHKWGLGEDETHFSSKVLGKRRRKLLVSWIILTIIHFTKYLSFIPLYSVASLCIYFIILVGRVEFSNWIFNRYLLTHLRQLDKSIIPIIKTIAIHTPLISSPREIGIWLVTKFVLILIRKFKIGLDRIWETSPIDFIDLDESDEIPPRQRQLVVAKPPPGRPQSTWKRRRYSSATVELSRSSEESETSENMINTTITLVPIFERKEELDPSQNIHPKQQQQQQQRPSPLCSFLQSRKVDDTSHLLPSSSSSSASTTPSNLAPIKTKRKRPLKVTATSSSSSYRPRQDHTPHYATK